METKKNRLNIIALIAIIITIVTVLIVIAYITFFILFALNFANPTGGHRTLQSKLHHKTVREITDSLNNTEWKYNLPADRKEQLYEEINDGGTFYYFKKSYIKEGIRDRLIDMDLTYDTTTLHTKTIVISIGGSYSTLWVEAVYTDSATMFSYRDMTEYKRKQFENLLKETVFQDIEKEAKRQNLPNSIIYVSKQRLKKYGYNDFAEKIYPSKKFLFWKYD